MENLQFNRFVLISFVLINGILMLFEYIYIYLIMSARYSINRIDKIHCANSRVFLLFYIYLIDEIHL